MQVWYVQMGHVLQDISAVGMLLLPHPTRVLMPISALLDTTVPPALGNPPIVPKEHMEMTQVQRRLYPVRCTISKTSSRFHGGGGGGGGGGREKALGTRMFLQVPLLF